ncbi:MAG: retropepsin-like aspartic protease [Paenibacillaceae bacterium]
MKLNLRFGLPFVSVELIFRGKSMSLDKVLLDTGSASTIFNANRLDTIGVMPEGDAVVDAIRGVGGLEYVYTKQLNQLQLDQSFLVNFQVEIGNMDYGIDLDGIIGFDFITAAELVIDTKQLIVYAARNNKSLLLPDQQD